MSQRRIHIEDKEWRYRIGGSNAVIRAPWNEKFVVPLDQLSGRSWDEIERAGWKGYLTGWFNPSVVKRYIEDHLIVHEKQTQI